VADDIERWSEELARDPGSGVFIPLADALRRRGQLDLAYRVATRGLARRPYDGDAHDLLARIWADRGDIERAMDEWSIALQCAPTHAGALKGLGFACYQAGLLVEAERYLVEAAATDPDDQSIRTALARVRQHSPQEQRVAVETIGDGPGPGGATPAAPSLEPAPPQDRGEASYRVDPRFVFAEVLDPSEQAALLVDADGLVLAGSYVVADGRDVAQEVGAALSGVSDEARRAMRHLGLGAWSSLVFEAEAATVGMTPVAVGHEDASGEGTDGVAFVAAGTSVPLGLVRRLLARIGARAQEWLARDARASR
jgi:tetratricopeptide (TPR) repeat protein